ncbi:DUF6082 family protein [Streptomyces sp. NPDC048518]|uniref:DUF6082 family protein n=1 Tax=Streptomyces sp. NPDC048518 TaxID=3155029 RepID=UPI0033D6A893
MTTQKMSIRGVGPAAVAGLSFATGTYLLLRSKGRRDAAHSAETAGPADTAGLADTAGAGGSAGAAGSAGTPGATGTTGSAGTTGTIGTAGTAEHERRAAERERAALAVQRRNAALTEQHRLHFDLLCKAMGDASLAAVLNTYEEDVSPERQRQFLFANALYINALHAHRIDAMTLQELHGHLRVMCQNQIFRQYWDATRHHRASLDRSSDEAKVGRMMDRLVQELDSAETDEWWVVGEPPTG